MAADPSIRILVVDDYSTMVRILCNLLRQIGFNNVDQANDGLEALTKLRSNKYSLVISDWNMQPINGYELLTQVRRDPALCDLPFIMITAESKTENVIAAKKTGVSGYIVKPFSAETLQGKISALFEDVSISERTSMAVPA